MAPKTVFDRRDYVGVGPPIEYHSGISLGFDPGVRTGALVLIDQDETEYFRHIFRFSKGTNVYFYMSELSRVWKKMPEHRKPDILIAEKGYFKYNHDVQFRLSFSAAWACGLASAMSIPWRVVTIAEARSGTQDAAPSVEGPEKDYYDARTLARFGKFLLRRIRELPPASPS